MLHLPTQIPISQPCTLRKVRACWLLIPMLTLSISSTESVGILRNIIQNKLSYAVSKAEACSSYLWEVSLPLDNRLEDELNNFNPDWRPLLPPFLLSNVFDVPPQAEHLHIVIRLPLQCIVKLTQNKDS
ncbi:uncharacterized protein BJ212DRAFT_1359503 [Suillus subaureus]|uniref:Crinkler effector protein N-terminal domain-containing protein n=1 Tax=Suillus subaureus TaxID=48587 RepID=A0A9P7EAB1_9AGAM|nr:uncharacterized protein BJ212DRAFT_1359503 [Suillus subaureus]KAG1815108.1 hypothetical protein BJ212DRAFT_1359503 [Suillus subaureus]